MKKITSKNLNSEFLNLINFDLVREKGLGTETLNEKYFEILNKYKSFFETYLKENLPLDYIDQNMKESELDFRPIKDSKKDFYQMTSTMNLTYIYLRNNLYIEKLSKEELQLLDSETEYNDKVKDFIKNTYKKVINPYDDSKIVFYGPENGQFIGNSNDIVLGIRYDEFESELDGNEFRDNFLAKQKIISQLNTLLNIVALKDLGSNLICRQYNEVSIMEKYKNR